MTIASPTVTQPEPTTASAILDAAARVRLATVCPPQRVAAALAQIAQRWRNVHFALRRDTVAQLATSLGMTRPLLDESLDALLQPLTAPALASLAPRLPRAHRLFGFVMPGNVPGSGIHEIAAALLAGAAVIIKSASRESVFFGNFVRSLAAADPAVAARIALVSFSREDRAAMSAMWAACEGGVVAYGDDASLAALAAAGAAPGAREWAGADTRPHGGACPRRFAGFGSRLSGALVALDLPDTAGTPGRTRPQAAEAAACGLARDVALFEQRGCLSPHHVFVVGGAEEARGFAARLLRALERLARRLPPPARLPLDAAAAIRGLRERARWRALAQPTDAAGRDIALWESAAATVIYDRTAAFSASPGYRTVFVSALDNIDELGARLGPAAGRLEAFALAAPPERREPLKEHLRRLGATYVCEPGQMQAPPLDWPHGHGAMFALLREAAR